MKYDPVDVARRKAYIREAQGEGQNRGLRVEAIQHAAGGQFGDSWCMEWAWGVFDEAFQGASPIPRMQACQTLYELAKANDWIVDDPAPGDLVLSIDPAADHAHHVGIVTVTAPLTSIAGNTSADGVSSNGDGVHEHEISAVNKVFVRCPREVAA